MGNIACDITVKPYHIAMFLGKKVLAAVKYS